MTWVIDCSTENIKLQQFLEGKTQQLFSIKDSNQINKEINNQFLTFLSSSILVSIDENGPRLK